MAMVLENAGHQDKYRAESKLCKREIQVLKLVAEGNTTLQIAAQLHIATGTVDVHRRNIIFKLDLHTVADLTKYAIREGMTST